MIRRLWPLVLGAFAMGLGAYVLAGLLPGMARDLATTPALAGLGVALFTAAYAVSAPTLAFVAERSSARTALIAGLGLFTLGNLGTVLAPSLTVLLAARLLAGIGAGLYTPLATSTASGLVEAHRRGAALSAVLAGLSTGTALGVPLGLLVADRFGWRWNIGLIVALGLLATAGVATRMGDLPAASPLTWRDRLGALRAPFTAGTLAVSLLIATASLGLYTYLAEVAAARGFAGSLHTLIWLWGLGGMTGALLIGRVIDRHLPAERAILLLLAVLAGALALVGWGGPAIFAVGCFLWGLAGWASVAPQQHALVSHDPRNATALIAWNASINYLGAAVGATIGSVALSAHVPARFLPLAAVTGVAGALLLHVAKRGTVMRAAVVGGRERASTDPT